MDNAMPRQKSFKSKLLWTVVFMAIAALTILAITSQKDFSFKNFIDFMKGLHPAWLLASITAMLGFIAFEGLAIRTVLKGFGYRAKLGNSFIYSSSDIYFSAITPSATGGQPASMYFMMRDGIPGSVVTLSLLVNLVMYSFSIIIIGIVCFIISPTVFLRMSVLCKVLVAIGSFCLICLALFFVLVIFKSDILHKVGNFGLTLLARLHIIKNLEKKKEKLASAVQSYNGHVASLKGKGGMLIKALVFNILQRLSVILVTVFVYLATGGDTALGIQVGIAHCLTILGTNVIPIPGAMGISDYMLISAFGVLGFEKAAAMNLNLVSRGISFYFCVILCGLSMIVKVVSYNIGKRKKTTDVNYEVKQ